MLTQRRQVPTSSSLSSVGGVFLLGKDLNSAKSPKVNNSSLVAAAQHQDAQTRNDESGDQAI
jgi:hypothetical protein